MLAALHATFNGQKEYFTNALFLMHSVDYFGRRLVKYSIDPHGSPYVGPNATPVFEWMALGLQELKNNFRGGHKAHKNGEEKKAEKQKWSKIQKRKGNIVKKKRGWKRHRKISHHRNVNGHAISKLRWKNRMKNRGYRISEEHRMVPEGILDYEREHEFRTNPNDYERERENSYREHEYRKDLSNYEDRLKQNMKLYEDIKDEMNMERIFEEMMRIKKMEDIDDDDDDDDDDDAHVYDDYHNGRNIDYYDD